MPKLRGRPPKQGADKGIEVSVYLTLRRRAILGRILPQPTKAIYHLIDSFDNGLLAPQDRSGRTIPAPIPIPTPKAAPAPPEAPETPPPSKPVYRFKCPRCQRIGYPACSTCRKANGLKE